MKATNDGNPIELGEDTLVAVAGGFEARPAKWKGFSPDGTTEGVTQGAFAEVSGLDSETEVIESQTDPAVLAIKT